ncbi:hypothetical protein AAFF_G00055280 [Aldrovandia affinis]|uniref:Uncharacterized protein n=1 Tax=Aldrovandia affinis TaxID=143900 RepID=A0AAD7S162_9TELE|nr:hypothetical protein AAFF_G00055280 [Aldrovandia affinis]
MVSTILSEPRFSPYFPAIRRLGGVEGSIWDQNSLTRSEQLGRAPLSPSAVRQVPHVLRQRERDLSQAFCQESQGSHSEFRTLPL